MVARLQRIADGICSLSRPRLLVFRVTLACQRAGRVSREAIDRRRPNVRPVRTRNPSPDFVPNTAEAGARSTRTRARARHADYTVCR